MRKRRPLPKPHNKPLNDLLVAKSKSGGPHKDRRKQNDARELRKTVKEFK
jgi:hypothetical protein